MWFSVLWAWIFPIVFKISEPRPPNFRFNPAFIQCYSAFKKNVVTKKNLAGPCHGQTFGECGFLVTWSGPSCTLTKGQACRFFGILDGTITFLAWKRKMEFNERKLIINNVNPGLKQQTWPLTKRGCQVGGLLLILYWHYWRYTHFPLIHDYGRKGIPRWKFHSLKLRWHMMALWKTLGYVTLVLGRGVDKSWRSRRSPKMILSAVTSWLTCVLANWRTEWVLGPVRPMIYPEINKPNAAESARDTWVRRSEALPRWFFFLL